ncbi:hypothetical protein EG329_008704 [Mollisiaceae sp. DMI_Dod_QoI]|nr:hypothetical protein EG329_008704 [Helotiales sp. DMI_Dod_QoI]
MMARVWPVRGTSPFVVIVRSERETEIRLFVHEKDACEISESKNPKREWDPIRFGIRTGIIGSSSRTPAELGDGPRGDLMAQKTKVEFKHQA